MLKRCFRLKEIEILYLYGCNFFVFLYINILNKVFYNLIKMIIVFFLGFRVC